ncbi:hypothetical protein IEQ34_014649 [Dendrobium chrysotoxum]|uniref:Uncharacterized protein n=1 Tax=Dendrobium chrysotoxum TaxID=161865 RepID=A0AAV7GL92_DENCH|nr:hypothetical protein IEQ34_014649 [Dendrobium chrysotoxum]
MERMLAGRESWRRFPEKSMKDSEFEDDKSSGISPENSLSAISSLCSRGNCPNPAGTVPLIRLFCILTLTRLWHVDKPAGIGPEKLLLKRMSFVRLPPQQTLSGIPPEKELDETSSHCNKDFRPRSPKPDGREPSSLLHIRFSSWRFVNLTNSCGILPEIKLSERSRETRDEMSAQASDRHVKVAEIGEIAEFRWNIPFKSIVSDYERFKIGKLAKLGGERPGEVFGIVPVKKQPRRSRVSSREALPTSAGRMPAKLFPDTLRVVSLGKEPTPTGKMPAKSLSLISSSSSSARIGKVSGRKLAKELQQRLRWVRAGRFRKLSKEMTPLRFIWERSSLSTNPSALHWTPVKLQWPPAAVAVAIFQSPRAFKGSTRPDFTARRADASSTIRLA